MAIPIKKIQNVFCFNNPNRKRVPHPKCGPTMTQQQFKEDSDINQIVKKFKDTGTITHVRNLQGTFGDFTNAMDYQTSLNKVIEAQESFNQLKASIRKRFKNDPARLVAFVNDPKNKREAAYLGLLNKDATTAVINTDKAKKQAFVDAKDKEIAVLKAQLSQKGPNAT